MLKVITLQLFDQFTNNLKRPRSVVTARRATEDLADRVVADCETPVGAQDLACLKHPAPHRLQISRSIVGQPRQRAPTP